MKEKHIILFDGDCSFCNYWVKFVIKNDKKDIFRFASLQSDIGKKLVSQYKIDNSIDSIFLIENEKVHHKSTAALKILKTLGGAKSILHNLIITPLFIRDFIYDVIAKFRYRLATQRSCELPDDKNFTHKFLM